MKAESGRRVALVPRLASPEVLRAMRDWRNCEVFFASIRKTGSCWVWTAGKSKAGYGMFGDHLFAHRFSYEYFHGPVPDGLLVDHICRNPSCVNPAHLRLATPSQNVRTGRSGTKLLCANGHRLVGPNLFPGSLKRGRRVCRICSLTVWSKRTRLESRRCAHCDRGFSARTSSGQRFCSRKCGHKGRRRGYSITKNRLVVVRGTARTIREWARLSGIKASTIYSRLKYGWSERSAVSVPTRILRPAGAAQ